MTTPLQQFAAVVAFSMLVASTAGVFLIPMLYVVFQRLREWFHGGVVRRGSEPDTG